MLLLLLLILLLLLLLLPLLLRWIFLILPFVSHLAIFCLLSKLVCAHWILHTHPFFSFTEKLQNKTIFLNTKCCCERLAGCFFYALSLLLTCVSTWSGNSSRTKIEVACYILHTNYVVLHKCRNKVCTNCVCVATFLSRIHYDSAKYMIFVHLSVYSIGSDSFDCWKFKLSQNVKPNVDRHSYDA